MLKGILDEHKRVEKELQKERDQAQTSACQALDQAVSLLVDLTDEGASNAFKQQQHIGKEVRDIKTLIHKVERQLHQYSSSLAHVHKALKQFGDIEHFLQVVDQEVRSVCTTLAALEHSSNSGGGDTQDKEGDTQHKEGDTQHKEGDTQHKEGDTQHKEGGSKTTATQQEHIPIATQDKHIPTATQQVNNTTHTGPTHTQQEGEVEATGTQA